MAVPANPGLRRLRCGRRHDDKFAKQRAARLTKLQKQIAPHKQDRLQHHAIIHRLRFEEVIAGSSKGVSPLPSKQGRDALATEEEARPSREQAEAALAGLQSRITPLEDVINQLTRQFWVTKDQVAAQN